VTTHNYITSVKINSSQSTWYAVLKTELARHVEALQSELW